MKTKYLLIALIALLLYACGQSKESGSTESVEATTPAISREEVPQNLKKSTQEEPTEESVEEEVKEDQDVTTEDPVVKIEGDKTEKEITQTDEKIEEDFKVMTVQNQDTEKTKKSQKIIKTARLRFQVKNLEKSIANIQTVLKKSDAYIASATQTRQYDRVESNVAIRVARQDFEKILEDVLKESIYLDTKDVQAMDVTEEFVDIMTRLKTKKKVEERYLEILQQAKTIQEILQVEEQIRVIREEIESKEGRLKYLGDQIKYSSITLEMYEKTGVSLAPEDSFVAQLGNGFQSGWGGILAFIVGLAYGWPMLLILGILAFVIMKFVKKRSALKSQKS
jgi:hypothetical protein